MEKGGAMGSRMDVEMPQYVYASYTNTDVVNNDFYFTIYREAEEIQRGGILRPALEVRVGGFEKLMTDPQTPPEQRKEQLKNAAEKLLDDLSSSEDWTKKYVYDEESGELSFVFASMTEAPSGYFTKEFFTDRFICFKNGSFESVLVHIQAWEYSPGGEGTKVCDCYRNIHIYYPPSITEFDITYAGEGGLKKAFVNPVYDDRITLAWKMQGNLGMICRLLEGVKEIARPVDNGTLEITVREDADYTLEIRNHIGICVSKQVEVAVTGWHKEGKAEGIPLNTGDGKEEIRLFPYRDSFYCYEGTSLYRSGDGLKWEVAAVNTDPGIKEHDYVACGIQDDHFYVMTGKQEEFLHISRYCFSDKKWESAEVSQHGSSTEAHFAFSSKRGCLAETVLAGISVMECDCPADWREWNANVWNVFVEGCDAVSSDFCFWKDSFYGVILCSDGCFHLYRCQPEIEEELYIQRAEGEKIYLLPTVNQLLILAGGCFYDAMEKKKIKEECMPDMRKGGWIGSGGQKVFGIFADGCFWTYQQNET